MKELTITEVDGTHMRLHADRSTMMDISDRYTFFAHNYKHMPAYRSGNWDGKIRLLNVMTGLLYRGLFEDLLAFCKDVNIDVEHDISPHFDVNLQTANAVAKHVNSPLEPREYQSKAVFEALSRDRATLLSPTASGKSFIIYLITQFYLHKMKKSILIITPSTSLVEQIEGDFEEYNNDETVPNQKIYSGKSKEITERVVFSTWQSAHKQPKEWFENFDVIIGDEAHTFAAKSLTALMEKAVNVKFRYGLTGTLDDDAKANEMTLTGLFGPVVTVTTTKDLMDAGVLSSLSIKAITLKHSKKSCSGLNAKKTDYAKEIDWIVSNEKRNKFLINLAMKLKGNTLLIFQLVEKHGDVLYEMAKKQADKYGKQVFYINGSTKVEERERIRKLAEENDNVLIIASYGTFSTGINVKRLHNLILGSPTKSKIRLLQSIGRILRISKDGIGATLYDISDHIPYKKAPNFTLNHFKKRVHHYINQQFNFKTLEIVFDD